MKLIAYTIPVVGSDPRRLIVLAVKVSSGKLHERSWEHYLTTYPEKDVHNFVLDAVKYPVVLEHIVFTFLIEGISRIASHQLVRHRLATYTQESQRYSESYMRRAVEKIVEYLGDLKSLYEFKRFSEIIKRFIENADRELVIEVAKESCVLPSSLRGEQLYRLALACLEGISRYYELVEQGVKIEDARFVIPQAIKTRILMTVNLRELLHIACLRISPHAQWEIREIVEAMLSEVSRVIPEIYELKESFCLRNRSS